MDPMNSDEQEKYLTQLRDLLAQIEAGEVSAHPSNEEAMQRLRAEIGEIESGIPLNRQPGFLTVGHPFPNGNIPAGTIGLYPDASPMLLVMGMGSPTPGDFEAFHSTDGWIEFALLPMGKLLVTMIRFPSRTLTTNAQWGLWMEAPWAHREDSWFELDRLQAATDPDDSKYMRYGINCVLVDSDTNLVVGMRFFTLSPHYSRTFERELLRRLNEAPITPEEFMKMAVEYQARYPDPKKLLDRAIVRCKAGLPGK